MASRARRVLVRVGLAALALGVVAGAVVVWKIGPRNVLGILLYDTRREGSLLVGHPAPDVALETTDGEERRLASSIGGQPLVLIFGSFT